MGVRYQIEADGHLYEAVDDCTTVYQAIFTGSVIDETSGNAIVSTLALTADIPEILLSSTDDALLVGSANVARVFPDLTTKAYNLNLTLSAFGYRPITVPINFPIASVLPLMLPAIVMRRLPVRLQGRVVRASDRTAITTATLASKDARHLILRDTIRSAHASGVAVNSLALTNVGAARSLTAPAARGDTALALSTTAGLAAGDLLQVGDLVHATLHQVASIGPDPGTVLLTDSLSATWSTAAVVQGVVASAPSGTTTLARSSDPGDGTASLAAALTDQAIEIADGPSTEYHWLNALSDAAGYYSANGIVGVKSLELLASAPSFTTLDQPWSPDYDQPNNILDILLRP